MDKFLSAVEKVQIVSKLFAIFSSKSPRKIVSSFILRKKKKKKLLSLEKCDMNNRTRQSKKFSIMRSKIYPSRDRAF